MGGVENDAAPSINKTTREIYYDIVNILCNKFIGMSPLEVLTADLELVFNLYTDAIISDYKRKQPNEGDVWVTSKTATWH